MESVSLGLLRSHFLIHVEYRNVSTTGINIEVIHKKSVQQIMEFFQAESNKIVKYYCKDEAEFVSYVNEHKKLVIAERSLRRKCRETYCRKRSRNHSDVSLSFFPIIITLSHQG